MADALDFRDMENQLYLSKKRHHDIAKFYAQLNILDLIDASPFMHMYNSVSEMVSECESGKYDPIELIDDIQKSSDDIIAGWAESCEEGEDVDEILATIREILDSKYLQMELSDELKKQMGLVGAISDLVAEVDDYAVRLREFYSGIVRNALLLASDEDTHPLMLINDQKYADELVRRFYQRRAEAEQTFCDLNFFELAIYRTLRNLATNYCTEGSCFEGLIPSLEKTPSVEEIENVLELNREHVKRQMDRIYSLQG